MSKYNFGDPIPTVRILADVLVYVICLIYVLCACIASYLFFRRSDRLIREAFEKDMMAGGGGGGGGIIGIVGGGGGLANAPLRIKGGDDNNADSGRAFADTNGDISAAAGGGANDGPVESSGDVFSGGVGGVVGGGVAGGGGARKFKLRDYNAGIMCSNNNTLSRSLNNNNAPSNSLLLSSSQNNRISVNTANGINGGGGILVGYQSGGVPSAGTRGSNSANNRNFSNNNTINGNSGRSVTTAGANLLGSADDMCFSMPQTGGGRVGGGGGSGDSGTSLGVAGGVGAGPINSSGTPRDSGSQLVTSSSSGGPLLPNNNNNLTSNAAGGAGGAVTPHNHPSLLYAVGPITTTTTVAAPTTPLMTPSPSTLILRQNSQLNNDNAVVGSVLKTPVAIRSSAAAGFGGGGGGAATPINNTSSLGLIGGADRAGNSNRRVVSDLVGGGGGATPNTTTYGGVGGGGGGVVINNTPYSQRGGGGGGGGGGLPLSYGILNNNNSNNANDPTTDEQQNNGGGGGGGGMHDSGPNFVAAATVPLSKHNSHLCYSGTNNNTYASNRNHNNKSNNNNVGVSNGSYGTNASSEAQRLLLYGGRGGESRLTRASSSLNRVLGVDESYEVSVHLLTRDKVLRFFLFLIAFLVARATNTLVSVLMGDRSIFSDAASEADSRRYQDLYFSFSTFLYYCLPLVLLHTFSSILERVSGNSTFRRAVIGVFCVQCFLYWLITVLMGLDLAYTHNSLEYLGVVMSFGYVFLMLYAAYYFPRELMHFGPQLTDVSRRIRFCAATFAVCMFLRVIVILPALQDKLSDVLTTPGLIALYMPLDLIPTAITMYALHNRQESDANNNNNNSSGGAKTTTFANTNNSSNNYNQTGGGGGYHASTAYGATGGLAYRNQRQNGTIDGISSEPTDTSPPGGYCSPPPPQQRAP